MSAPDAAGRSEHLASLRREYGDAGIDAADLPSTPLEALRAWLADAEAAGLSEPNAMVVASATPEGTPSVRTVLLKGLDERGLVFYSNYGSRKAGELEATGRAAVLFPWHDLQRQLRVEGRVERVTREESEAYWVQRPRGSQLGALASPQSQEVASREELDERYAEVERAHEGRDVPLPEGWGGYRVGLEVVELWQGRGGRMHDRLVYRPAADGAGWTLVRLAP